MIGLRERGEQVVGVGGYDLHTEGPLRWCRVLNWLMTLRLLAGWEGGGGEVRDTGHDGWRGGGAPLGDGVQEGQFLSCMCVSSGSGVKVVNAL